MRKYCGGENMGLHNLMGFQPQQYEKIIFFCNAVYICLCMYVRMCASLAPERYSAFESSSITGRRAVYMNIPPPK
jgi:hypothetical protein